MTDDLVRKIEHLVIKALENNQQRSKPGLVSRIAADLSNGESHDALIASIIEGMADRMMIIETSSGKYRLNE